MCVEGGSDGEAQVEIINKGNKIPIFRVKVQKQYRFPAGICHLKRKTGF